MAESITEKFENRPLSIQPADWARIGRWAQAESRSTSAHIRHLVMPLVEAWEQHNGLPPVVCEDQEK